jgi:TetR/AcrR family transcriptional repressor of nem operon
MPRPKQYKYEAVLEKAMDLFWTKGYNGTSVQELVDHLKLSKASMYEAFEDKHGLFMATLHNYRKRLQNNLKMLEEIPSPLQAIRISFQSVIEDVTDKRHRRGGYLTNTAIEMAPHDAEVEQWVIDSMSDYEELYKKLLRSAIEKGELKNVENIDAKAYYLTNVLQGLMVYAKVKQDKAKLNAIMELSLKHLS